MADRWRGADGPRPFDAGVTPAAEDGVRHATPAHGSTTGRRILGLEVPAALAVDLDTEEQWAVAELALQHPGLVRPAAVTA